MLAPEKVDGAAGDLGQVSWEIVVLPRLVCSEGVASSLYEMQFGLWQSRVQVVGAAFGHRSVGSAVQNQCGLLEPARGGGDVQGCFVRLKCREVLVVYVHYLPGAAVEHVEPACALPLC